MKDEWSLKATAAIECLAATVPSFTADEVWRLLNDLNDSPKINEPRRLGARLQDAARRGIIRPGQIIQSTRSQRHKAPVRVWISNAISPEKKLPTDLLDEIASLADEVSLELSMDHWKWETQDEVYTETIARYFTLLSPKNIIQMVVELRGK